MPNVTANSEGYDIVPVPGRRHVLRRWVARAAWALAVLTPLVFVVAALGAKLGVWSWQFGLGTLTRTVGTNMLFATLAVGVVSLLLAVVIKPRLKRGLAAGIVATAVGLAGLAYGASVRATATNLPFIHDVTTDTQNPPVFAGRIIDERAGVKGVNTLDYVGKTDRGGTLVSVLQAKGYPALRPIITQDSPEIAYARALEIAGDLGWEVKDADAVEGAIEATATTFWYGFEDDVVIRVRPGAGGGSVVDLRSISRVGGSDLGANAARIEAFVERFEG